MALKIELKPFEKIIVGNAIITNDGERTRFVIDGDVPILREKFLMKEEEANTPSKRLYYVVLQMYLDNNSRDLQKLYIQYVMDLQSAAPSLIENISEINLNILSCKYYQALQVAIKLIDLEEQNFGDIK